MIALIGGSITGFLIANKVKDDLMRKGNPNYAGLSVVAFLVSFVVVIFVVALLYIIFIGLGR